MAEGNDDLAELIKTVDEAQEEVDGSVNIINIK